jgi:NADP-dependent 3-hydroxy acid dehydrogenase YdfG
MAASELAGRTALVTGGSGGIGGATARALAAAGARVAIAGRRAEMLAALAGEIGGDALVADLSDPRGSGELASRARELFGGAPDVLVNAAGAFRLAPLAETAADDFAAHLRVNLETPFLLIRAFLPEMLRRGAGHVVSIGSVAGRAGFAHNGAYSASKFGLRGLHAVLDAELRGTGVRATLVEPAATDTTLWDAIDREASPGLPAPAAMLRAEDVASAVLYAVSRPDRVAVRNLIMERS